MSESKVDWGKSSEHAAIAARMATAQRNPPRELRDEDDSVAPFGAHPRHRLPKEDD